MKFIEKKIAGMVEFVPEPNVDSRGFFMRTYDEKVFKQRGFPLHWVQENHSKNERQGIVRGLHFQFPPFSETKLIRCVRGEIFDVCVDLRKDSDTFGQWDAVKLSEENKRMVLIPRGCAHGFCTLTTVSDVLYKHDNYYNPENEGGIVWNDPDIGVEWPVDEPFLSARDKGFMTFRDFERIHSGLQNRNSQGPRE